MPKFSELGPVKQMLTLLGMLGVTGSAIASLMLYAADQKIDEKYATDADVRAVQEQVKTNVESLTTSVNQNTAALRQTASSVDNLTLTVLDLQIREVAQDVDAMERDKLASGPQAWSQGEEARLREKRQALEDLRTQRALLFDRLIAQAAARSRHTLSCGCRRRNNSHSITHGRAGTRTWRIWCAMRQRCENPNRTGYERYGGRGITVCARWQQFEHFLADMGECPPSLTIDRIDNDGNYEPSNCRWADRFTQAQNRS